MLIIALIILIFMGLGIQPILTFLYDKKGLRKFPSPSVAGITSLWRIYHNLRYEHYLAIHEAHQAFGTHVRIAPNHVSILEPRAINDIYGHGAGLQKDAWYDGGAGEYRHMADARDKAEHQGKRKMLAHVFAQKTIAGLEPVIADTVSVLVAQCDKFAVTGDTINMRRYLNYFTIDIFSEILYGRTLGCMERGDDIVDAETLDGKIFKVPFIKALHDATHINTVLGMEAGLLPITLKLFAYHPYKKMGADFESVIYHNTKLRARDTLTEDDIFSKLLKNAKGEDTGILPGDLLAECSVMMNAGTDTTTAALTNTLFLLYKHPKVLARLREELDAATGTAEVPTYEQVANLPYLRACIEESLRVRPASSFGLPREVPKGGRVIAGEFIPEGTTVSVPTYSMLRMPGFFDKPEVFNPDRWITGDKEKMLKVHLPFSTGPRACIGRNIAYFEQILVVATLVRLFDFELESPNFDLETIERFNSNPGELPMTCRRRRM